MKLHKPTRSIVLKLRDPSRVTSVIPKSRVVKIGGVDHVQVKHGVEESIVLNNLGIKAPMPINYYYNWPGRYRPFAHQKTTAEFYTRHMRCFNLSDMGCVDATTEFLTPTGWKRIDQYAEGDMVMQYDPATQGTEFVVPEAYIDKPSDGFYMFWVAGGLTQVLSPEHRVLLESGEVWAAKQLFDFLQYNWSMRLPVMVEGKVTYRHIELSRWAAPEPNQRKYCFTVPTGFLVLRRNGCIFVTGNSGKSLATVHAADHLMNEGVVKRAIILAPLSCLDKVWAQEIFTAATHRRFAILHGTAEKRRTLLADPHYDFYIINHDGYEIIAKQVHARTDINLIIVDEASEYRNAGTKRYKAFQHSLRADVRLWMLTGTPTPTAPTDAWALSKLVNPSGVHPSFTRFKERVMLQVSSYKWVPRPDAQEEVYRILQPAIRFDKRDCIDLPPTTYLDREAALSAAQKLAYEDMRKHMVLEAGGETITAANAAVKLGKLIQISCGVLYGPEKTRHHIGAPERIKVLKECIEQAGAKVIVFVPLTGALEYVASELRKHWTVAVVDGSVSANKRNQIFGDFQNSKDPHILVAHPETASHGLTLVAADMTIWYAPIFSADQYLQANNRTTRPGQTRHTTIVHIGSSEIEWAVYRTLRERKRVQETVLDLYRKITDKNA